MTRLNPTCRFACMLLLAIAVTATPAAAQSAAIDPSLAARYFREAERLSAADGGHLWLGHHEEMLGEIAAFLRSTAGAAISPQAPD